MFNILLLPVAVVTYWEWTLLGMFIAWIVLDGSAKDVVGWATIGTLIAWIATYPLRNKED